MSQRSGRLRPTKRRLISLACVCILSVQVLPLEAQACPTTATAGKGIKLASPDGRSSTIAWLDGGRVRLSEINPAAPKSFPREMILMRGLLTTETSSPSAKSRTVYSPEAEQAFPLAPGKQHEFAYTSEVEGRPPLKARMALAVTEALQHKVGTCTYDALLVVRLSEFENGQRTPVRYDVYVPALLAIVKSTMFDEANNAIVEQESFEFETITEK